jgi:predicted RNase H-like HicB family nuclease
MNSMAERIVYRAEFFQEGGLYVGLAPELNVSSFGDTLDEARLSLQEAVDAFAETCQTMGTFDEVMEESGFTKRGASWIPRQPVAAELSIAGSSSAEPDDHTSLLSDLDMGGVTGRNNDRRPSAGALAVPHQRL